MTREHERARSMHQELKVLEFGSYATKEDPKGNRIPTNLQARCSVASRVN